MVLKVTFDFALDPLKDQILNPLHNLGTNLNQTL